MSSKNFQCSEVFQEWLLPFKIDKLLDIQKLFNLVNSKNGFLNGTYPFHNFCSKTTVTS